MVNRRAQKILASTWVPPSSLHQDILYSDKYPDGKLFNTISNGIRKMPGYASQIKAEDRWAIVAYVRALQMSQNASKRSWEKQVLSDELRDIMHGIHERCRADGEDGEFINYARGANIAGFRKVANAVPPWSSLKGDWRFWLAIIGGISLIGAGLNAVAMQAGGAGVGTV